MVRAVLTSGVRVLQRRDQFWPSIFAGNHGDEHIAPPSRRPEIKRCRSKVTRTVVSVAARNLIWQCNMTMINHFVGTAVPLHAPLSAGI